MPQPEAHSPISPELARDWVQRYLAADNSHVLERLLSLVTDDVTYVHARLPGGVAQGKAAVSEFLTGLWTAFPDLVFEAAGEPFVSVDGGRMALSGKRREPSLAPMASSSPRACILR